ncbi:MAG: hypothetical protein AVDCRST_MAG64-3887, partial [uncultured Phycisphaerae bacterium]
DENRRSHLRVRRASTGRADHRAARAPAVDRDHSGRDAGRAPAGPGRRHHAGRGRPRDDGDHRRGVRQGGPERLEV